MQIQNLINDFIDQAYEGRAIEAEATFNDMMAQKVSDALETKKQEVASAMFNRQEEQQ